MILAEASASAQHGKRRLQIARTFIAERRRFHAAGLSASRAARIASTTRHGVIGDCINSTPSGRSASLTALAIAAGGAMAPPSPMPFSAELGVGRRRLHVIETGSGTSVGPGQQIVGERRRQRLARRVERHLLVQRGADALGQSRRRSGRPPPSD